MLVLPYCKVELVLPLLNWLLCWGLASTLLQINEFSLEVRLGFRGKDLDVKFDSVKSTTSKSEVWEI